MKLKSFTPMMLASALLFSTGAALAGTAGLNGNFTGDDVTLNVRSYGPLPGDWNVVQGVGTGSEWTWHFNGSCGTVTITDGELAPTLMPGGPFDYRVRAVGSLSTTLPIVDNGDGTYDIPYHFEVDYPGGTRRVDTFTRLDITLAGGSINIITTDPDGDTIPGVQIPATSSTPPFPKDIEQEWVGSAN